MSTATATCTFADLKDCVTRLLLDLACHVMPDTYGCPACDNAMCPAHCEQAAAQERLEKAAAMTSRAATEDEVKAAVTYAAGGNGGAE